jgi:hypothetical protein
LNPAFSGPVILGGPGQEFDPNAFILPAIGTYGNLSRGGFAEPGLADLVLSLFKDRALSEGLKLPFRSEFFNLLNGANFGSPNPIVSCAGATSSSAGLITSTATTSRQIQFGLKLIL